MCCKWRRSTRLSSRTTPRASCLDCQVLTLSLASGCTSTCSTLTAPWLGKRHAGSSGLQGLSQQVNINYDEMFSTIVKPGTIHIVLKIIASRDWPIHQLVVKNTFLHGHLGGPCTTSSHRAMWTPLFPTMFVFWQKSLYGPKQAPWAWNQRFASYICSISLYSCFFFTSGPVYASVILPL